MKLWSAVVAMATAVAIFVGACSSFSGNGSGTGGSSGGGTGGTGGRSSSGTGGATGGSSSSGGAGGACANVTACGGNVVGTWTVSSSCLSVSGPLDLSSFFGQGCASAQVTGSLQVSGTWSANSDGTYTDNTTTTGNEQIALVAACLSFSGTTITCDGVSGVVQAMGYSSVNCTTAAGGGCNCSATVNQAGGIGVVSASASTSGSFSTSGSNLTIDTSPPYAYCVSGNKLTLTPQAPTTGTVVLQGGGTGTTGSGGATGGSGAVGARGGSTGVGGAAGGGTGAAGAGGATGTAGAAGANGIAGASGAGGAPVAFQGPCDIYAAANPPTPCVAAFSTVRVLSSKYTGPLYQVRMGGSNSGTGGTLKDIGRIAGGVFADGPSQDAFCGTSACTISKLYDQSGEGNDLTVEGAGCYVTTPDNEANAKGHSLTVSGHKVYALYTVSQTGEHDGYRNDKATGLPTGTAAQGVYEVVDGTRSNTGCCWDFGSARRDNCYTGGTGTMDTIFFGKSFWMTGAGNGPWFMADFEGGVWTGGSAKTAAGQNSTDPAVTSPYAFGVVKTNTNGNTPQWAMRVGNAQSGGVTTAYDGQAPATWNLQGAVVLGTGGDNSNGSYGTFFEGAITSGRPSDATDLAIQQNAQAAGYGK
jgi:hypothetical protein